MKSDRDLGEFENSEASAEAEQRFGVDAESVREAVKPLFLQMYRHGIRSLTIERDGAKGKVVLH